MGTSPVQRGSKPWWKQELRHLQEKIDGLVSEPNSVHTIQIVIAENMDLKRPKSQTWSCDLGAYSRAVRKFVAYDSGAQAFGKSLSLVGEEDQERPYWYKDLLGKDKNVSPILAREAREFEYGEDGPWEPVAVAADPRDLTKKLDAWRGRLAGQFGERGATFWVTQRTGLQDMHSLPVSSAFAVLNRPLLGCEEYDVAKVLRDFMVGAVLELHRAPQASPIDENALRRIYGECEESVGRDIAEQLQRHQSAVLSRCPMLIVGESGTGKLGAAKEVHWLRQELRQGSQHAPRVVNASELVGNAAAIRQAISAAVFPTGMPQNGAIPDGVVIFNDIHRANDIAQDVILELLDCSFSDRAPGRDSMTFSLPKAIFVTLPGLDVAANSGRFNNSLYMQICPFTICCEPLRQRREDIRAIVESKIRILQATLGLDGTFVPTETDWRYITEHQWPGNFRDLHTYLIKRMLEDTSNAGPQTPRT